jgi:membrane carboxypeptidase/penicillin-binding protein PbpC
MRAILQGQPDRPFVRPEGLVQVDVCDLSGLLPTRDCQHVRSEWFVEGTEPVEHDAVYHIIFLDSATGGLANAHTPTERIYPLAVYDLPTAAIPWAREAGLPLYSDYFRVEADPQAEPILLLQPRPNTTYRLVDSFDRDAQQLLVEAVTGQPVSELTFWVDDVLLATFTAPPYRTWWPLAAGEHRFRAEAVLADGSRIASETVTILVNYEVP